MQRTLTGVKCVIWDLDETLWQGTLLEGGPTLVSDATRACIEMLDQRGIVQSIASRNDAATALAHLDRMSLTEYFLYPQIGWGAKSEAIGRLADVLGLAPESFLFVDDAQYERDEVRSVHPDVRCVGPDELDAVLATPGILPEEVTEDARNRRQLYRAEQARRVDEEGFCGPRVEFLRSLSMELEIRRATVTDLARAAELTNRTHQLNTTGKSYSIGELGDLATSGDHDVLIASLEDRYGSYGRIGLALVRHDREAHVLGLFLVSCRVMSRNVGTAFLTYIIQGAEAARLPLYAELVPTDRNRLMRMTYRLQGFQRRAEHNGVQLYSYSGPPQPRYPEYIEVQTPHE